MKIAGLKLFKINRIGKDTATVKEAENRLRRLEKLEKAWKEKIEEKGE